ncbi:MAG: hypothetical protein IKV26_00395 [Paludibacteraceae bacterium]|nr:hypothetical protein [Paludibacteraceae bacterium]
MTTETKFLISVLVEKLTIQVMNDYNLSEAEALDLIYNSQLYEKILDLETGLYYQSAGYNYELLKSEIEYGKIK